MDRAKFVVYSENDHTVYQDLRDFMDFRIIEIAAQVWLRKYPEDIFMVIFEEDYDG